jgi:hypothetical protein
LAILLPPVNIMATDSSVDNGVELEKFLEAVVDFATDEPSLRWGLKAQGSVLSLAAKEET